MSLLMKRNDELFITCEDNIIRIDLEKASDQQIKIPKPILPENLTKGQIDVLQKENRTITSVGFSKSGNLTVVSTENKQVIVYNGNFEVLHNIVTQRGASKVCFSPSNDIIVADKTGDVYLFEINNDKVKSTLLLGHLSMILDVVVSECGKYIVTCDRDEKIRVSHFPNCYNIASFCLGHSEFVTRILTVGNMLVSASGDGTVRLWNYLEGAQIGLINTNEYIDDNSLLKKFSQKMDEEKVEIFALPVSNIQIYKREKLYIAVSIHCYDAIQLYSVDLNTLQSIFLSTLPVTNPFSFCFSDRLYVLSNALTIFELAQDKFVKLEETLCEKIYEKYNPLLRLAEDDSIMVLYKRKFDNVQEYLERKRQRLEAR